MTALSSVFGRFSPPHARDNQHREAMRLALEKLALASLQIAEARTIEDLDVGRAYYQSALAELQQVIRTAKREWGIPLRPVAECEELHRELLRRFNRLTPLPPPLIPPAKKARARE